MTILFGDVRLEPAARRIWRGGEPVHLTRKAFELLMLLVNHRPEVVTKEVIHQHLWAETFVSEASLQALVSEIRQAVGDDGRRQEIIRTVHGVGYALNAQPQTAAGPSSANQAAAWLIGEVRRVPLQEGDNILGRSSPGVIDVEDTTVSRRHARIHIGAEAFLEDLGSKNGTWLGDESVTAPVPLTDGAVVRLGSARFTFRLERPGASTDSVPEWA